jgi:hypothetical protein
MCGENVSSYEQKNEITYKRKGVKRCPLVVLLLFLKLDNAIAILLVFDIA